MPHYLAIGVTWERFMNSCPKELEPYDIAHQKKLEEQDYLQYLWWGNYGVAAMGVAVEHCLNGEKAKSKFLEEPILKKLLENATLTEEEMYEKELQKAISIEEQWILAGRAKGLPETII